MQQTATSERAWVNSLLSWVSQRKQEGRKVLNDPSFFYTSPPQFSLISTTLSLFMKPPFLCQLYPLPIPQGNSTPRHPKGHKASSFVSFWGLPSTITLGSGQLPMEAVFCPGFLVLTNGRMSWEVGKQTNSDSSIVATPAGYLTHYSESKSEC